jgi:chemotaxis protein histidine kinase CheA
MAQVNLGDYKNLYIETVKKSINSLNELCDELTSNALDKEAIDNLHIASHSLKGRSQTMGFENIAKTAEIIEKKSDTILKGISKIDNEFIVNLKDSINKLNLELIKIEKGVV